MGAAIDYSGITRNRLAATGATEFEEILRAKYVANFHASFSVP